MTVTETDALSALLGDLVAAKERDAPISELQALITRGSMKVLSYKGSSRAASEATEALREETTAARAALEVANLRLQNLLYEQRHYEADIRACLRHSSAFSDADIELMPQEEFLAAVGDSVATVLAGGDENAVTVARLQHEKAGRVALLKQLEVLRAHKNELVGSVAQKTRFLEMLRAELASLEKAAAPVRSQLGLGAPLTLPPEAESLPLPLYVLYSQLSAAHAPSDATVHIRVVPSPSMAPAPAAVGPTRAAGSDFPAASATEENGDDTAMEEGEAQPAQQAMDEVHPQAILAEVGDKSASMPARAVVFVYVPSAHAVRALPAKGMDAALLPLLNENDSSASGAFRWAQRLAGLDFIPAPLPGAAVPTGSRAAAAGHVLAGLAEYRQQQRAEKALEQLRLARRPVPKS